MSRRALARLIGRIADLDAILTPPVNLTFTERVAILQAQGVTVHRWGRSVNASGTTYTMEVGANGTIVNPVTGDYNQGALLEDSNGGSSLGLSGAFPDPTYISFASVEQATFELTVFPQIDRVQTSTRNLLVVGDGGANSVGGAECKIIADGVGGYRFRFHSRAAAGGHVIKEGSSTGQVAPIGETIMLSYLREAANMRCFLNNEERTLSLIQGALETWQAPAAGTSYLGAFVDAGASSGGLDALLGEWLITSPLTAQQRAYLAAHPRRNRVIAKAINGGTIDEGAASDGFETATATHPAIGTLAISTAASAGTLVAGAETLIYTPPASVGADTPVTAAYTTTHGGVTSTPAAFSITVNNSVTPPPSANLPEDAPLPTPLVTKNVAAVANFDSVVGGANPGDRINLVSGSYGTKTISVSGTSANPIVIRATTLHGATFTGITLSGNWLIVSGVNIDKGSTAESGSSVLMDGSNNRVTRSILQNGGQAVTYGANSADTLVDHCDVKRFRERYFILSDPKTAVRMTVARCWVHEMMSGGTNVGIVTGFSWTTENVYREKHINAVARLNYVGPGKPAGQTTDDWIHSKASKVMYAFNRFDQPGGELLSQRFGLRNRWVGNYEPGAPVSIYDDLGWFYGNDFNEMRAFAGSYAYYDDTQNLVVSPCFHTCKRVRFSGNNATLQLGYTSNQDFCNMTSNPAVSPDPQPAGGIKPSRSFGGVTYAADSGAHADVGIKIRAHSGSIVSKPNSSGGACGASFAWVENLDSSPGTAAPGTWLTELVAEYPWITGLCPNPTSLTGGPGGSAPWSIAQALTRGDVPVTATNPNTGPFRPSPGGLP